MLRFFSKDVTIDEIKTNEIKMVTEYYIDESGITLFHFCQPVQLASLHR